MCDSYLIALAAAVGGNLMITIVNTEHVSSRNALDSTISHI